jgi:hypothetical protein
MWSRDENRMALLELHHSGELLRRRNQEEIWQWLAELPWTRCTARRNVLSIASGRNSELEQLLTRIWPEWPEILQRLTSATLPVTEKGFRKLRDMERAAELGPVPARLNRRTATALVGPHSKASLSSFRREALAEVDTTRDGIVRLRPNKGLVLERRRNRVQATFLVDIAGEVVLTERALIDGTRLSGRHPQAVLLVENLGPYLDLRAPDDWLVAHVPGWNTATIRLLLEQLPQVPIVHFGDLDPNGVRIALHLRATRPDIHWAVPEFWREYVRKRGRRLAWPEELKLDAVPTFVKELAHAGLWLEQETIALDERLCGALEALLRRRSERQHPRN